MIKTINNSQYWFLINNLNKNNNPFISNLNPNKIGIKNYTTSNIIKLRKVSSKYSWKHSIYNINNKIFSKILFEKYLNQFWNQIQDQFTENNHMFILFKIKYNNGEFSSIGKVQRINKNDKLWYIDYILETMKFKSEYYNETQIDLIIFSYGFKNEKIKNKQNLNKVQSLQKYKNLNLPISMDPLDYGRIINENILDDVNIYIIQNEINQAITLNKFEKYNEVEFFKSGISLIKFKDEFINENKFIRIINNKKYYFEDNKQILFKSEMKTKFIRKLNKSKTLNNNFLTLDIETYIKDNVLIPYLISIYDGKSSYSFYLNDYNNHEDMIISALKSILIRKYNSYNIYIHNMAKFDIIFLFKFLVKVGNVQPIIHNGRIISITINYGKNNEYQIHFKDSYLLLLSSLNKLTTNFGVENRKSIFPHLFVNESNLNYVGSVPNFKYFDNKITLDEYDNYKNSFNSSWNLKNEAIEYCIIDSKGLHQVVSKFAEMIFNLFSINIHKYPTLPSLAFTIYRTKFMLENTIPQLSGKIANDIR